VFRNTTYSLLASHDAATSVSLPLVKEYFGGQGGRCTGVQIVPVGGAAQLRLVYKAGSSTFTVQTTGTTTGKTVRLGRHSGQSRCDRLRYLPI
jgi:hypothetical protein